MSGTLNFGGFSIETIVKFSLTSQNLFPFVKASFESLQGAFNPKIK